MHLFFVQSSEAGEDPVVAEIGCDGLHELVRRAPDEPIPLFLGEGESHHGLVSREGQVDDAADPKLHSTANDRLVAPG